MDVSRFELEEVEEYDLDPIIKIIDEIDYDDNNPELARHEITRNISGGLDINSEVGQTIQSVAHGSGVTTDGPTNLDTMIEDYRRQFNAIVNEFQAGGEDSLDSIITEYRSDFEGIMNELENSEDSLHVFLTIVDAQNFFSPVDLHRPPPYSPTSPFYSPKSPTYSPSYPHYSPLSSIYSPKLLSSPSSQEYSPAAPFNFPVSPTGPKYSPSSPQYYPIAPIAPMYSPNSPNLSPRPSSIPALNLNDEDFELSHHCVYPTNDQDPQNFSSPLSYVEEAHIHFEFPLMDTFLQVVRAGLTYVRKTSEDLLESEQEQNLLGLGSRKLEEFPPSRQISERQDGTLQRPTFVDGYSLGLYAGEDSPTGNTDTKMVLPTQATVISPISLISPTTPLVVKTTSVSKSPNAPQKHEISGATNKQSSALPPSPTLSPLSSLSSFLESPTAPSPPPNPEALETAQGEGGYIVLEVQDGVGKVIFPDKPRIITLKEDTAKLKPRRSTRIAALKCTRQAIVVHGKHSDIKESGNGVQKRQRRARVVAP